MKLFSKEKDFYRKVFIVAVQIMIQNGISNFVSMLDNIMIGQVGTEPMSGVAVVNQLMFVLYLGLFGALSGPGVSFSAASASFSFAWRRWGVSIMLRQRQGWYRCIVMGERSLRSRVTIHGWTKVTHKRADSADNRRQTGLCGHREASGACSRSRDPWRISSLCRSSCRACLRPFFC